VSGEHAETVADAIVPSASPWRAVVLAAFIVACVAGVTLTPVRDVIRNTGVEELQRDLRELGPWAPWVFLVACAAGVAVGVPRLALAALSGVLFDWFWGALLAGAGTLLGSWGTFVVARSLGRDFVETHVRRRFPRAGALLDLIGRHGFLANLILRLAPVGNCFATNLLFALSPVTVGSFLLGTFLGTLPETFIVAYGASAVLHPVRLAVAAILLVVLALAVWWWTRHTRLRERTP
jgi:uncharacterized membrane protein YdjX (TVP38/TMEM64 family)